MIVVSMMVRNETDRHLKRALESAYQVAHLSEGVIVVTDDASGDNTAEVCESYGAMVRVNDEPQFWKHEGKARQRHYEWTSEFCRYGDWVLSLDADESINDPKLLLDAVARAKRVGYRVIQFPLYEFWDEEHYRTDGWWFGTKCSRLYAWQANGHIADREMGCGSEPTYVQDAIPLVENDLHLLHWGYMRESDRQKKYCAYSSRVGGHGHASDHVESIIQEPELKRYRWS